MKHYVAFIALAFGISWLIWISAHRLGARPGVGEEILAFGSAGPGMAAIFLSRSGRKVCTVSVTTRLLWFGFLWAACWAIYMVSDKMRGVTPTWSLGFGLIVALLSAIPAWIGSGAFSSDTGVHQLLHTITVPRDWRWQVVAFFSFPAILVVPTAILHAFGTSVVWQRRSGTLWSLAAYAALMFLRSLFFTAFGNWQVSWTDKDGNSRPATIQIKQDGSKLSGKFEGQSGNDAQRYSFPLSGSLRGNHVSLTINVQTQRGSSPVTATGTVDGDSMKGTTMYGKPWTATRQ